MIHKILMADLAEGLQSVLTLTCLEDIILYAAEADRISLLNELDTRYLKPINSEVKPIDETLLHQKINRELVSLFRRATGRDIPLGMFGQLKDDFIYIQEFLHSAIPSMVKDGIRDVEVLPGLVLIRANNGVRKSYTFG